MRFLTEKKALELLRGIRQGLAREVAVGYEHRAKSCLTCDTPGACCLDEHFVNVRISRLEAAAISHVLRSLSAEKQAEINERADIAVEKYGLNADGGALRTFACPLYEKGTGCLVHHDAKPLPCIQHACYENAADLPPDELLDRAEASVDALNRRTYRTAQPLLPLPVAIRRFRRPS